MLFASSAGGSLAGTLLPFVCFLALLAAVTLRGRAKRRAMFRACVEGLGAELVRSDNSTFTATVRGLRLDFDLHAGGKNTPNRTYITATAEAPFALVLYLRPQTSDEERAVAKGDAIDIVIGDPTLDPDWIIEGAPRERVVRMFEDPALRSRLRDLGAVKEPSVTVEDDHVLVKLRDFDLVGDAVATERIMLALALAWAAAAESARPLDAEGAADYRTATRPDRRGELAQITALKRGRAAREMTGARTALILSQLAIPGVLLVGTMTASARHPVTSGAIIIYLMMHAMFARFTLGAYLPLRKVLGPSSVDTATLAVVGLANALLLGLLASALLG